MKGRLEPAALSSAISLKARQLAYWWVSWPLAAQILSIYGISRLWGWLIFSSVGLHQTYGPWKNGPMAYGEFVMIWDADWYEKIASGGYPSQLPLDSQGQVAQNEWAFYPLYPLLVGALSRMSGLDYSLLAPLVSLIFGAGASYWIYRLGLLTFSRQAAGLDGPAEAKGAGAPTEPSRNPAHSKALWFLALVNTLAVFPIVHTGYAEACGLFFLTWTLCYLLEGRYLPLLFPALAASLSRPLGVPLGATLGLYWFFCWYQAASASSWLAAFNNKLPQLLSALAACCFAFIHPALAWLATGRLDAYTATEAAWRAGGEEVLPFLPWWTQSQ
ncbi:MAG: hypothetical protein SOR40_08035, partial [Rothia sp. (in: high G+C Gram-positive bacteria)]|nr:hypothetical protein [Rothia sp. (in: high G+C Gram-positive bacteria)]